MQYLLVADRLAVLIPLVGGVETCVVIYDQHLCPLGVDDAVLRHLNREFGGSQRNCKQSKYLNFSNGLLLF